MENLKYSKLVSIIIPVYNGDKYLYEAIDSAIKQTYKNIEVIVIDDGSFKFNNYKPILAKFKSTSIRFIKIGKNLGVSSVMNIAIKNANGYYINWLSHDDYFDHRKIEKQLKILEINNLENGVCFSHFISFNENKNYRRKINVKSFLFNKKNWLLMSDNLHGCSLLIPKHLIVEEGLFDENLKFTQDYDMWMRLLNKGVKFILCDEYLLFSRRHSLQDSVTMYDQVYFEKNNFYISKLSEYFDKEKNLSLFDINTYLIFSSFIYRGYIGFLFNFIESYRKKSLYSKISMRVILMFTILTILPIYYFKKYIISLRKKIYDF